MRANEEWERQHASEDRFRDPAASPEKQERQRDDQANEATGETVRPFPPVERLELRQRDARVNGASFRDLQVLVVFAPAEDPDEV